MNVFQDAVELLTDAQSRQAIRHALEATAETFIEQGGVDSIPILREYVRLERFGISLTEKLYVKRLMTFFEETESVPIEEMRRFAKKLETNKDTERFGELILTAIEKTDSTYKARLIGILLRQVLLGKLEKDKFEYLAFVVARTHIQDLYSLYYSTKNHNILDSSLAFALSSSRIVDVSFSTKPQVVVGTSSVGQTVQSPKYEFKINSYGKALAEAVGLLIEKNQERKAPESEDTEA